MDGESCVGKVGLSSNPANCFLRKCRVVQSPLGPHPSQVDWSPTGSGVIARTAVQYHKGRIK